MATTSTSSTTAYDPTSTAAQLATKYTAGTQALLTTQTKAADATASALSKLSSAMGSFEASLSALSTKKSMLINSASFSSAVGTATADASAATGTYNFYVERLATAGQVSYGGISDTAAAGSGSLNVMLADGSNFNVNLNNADKDLDGTLTAKEIATAINVAADNNSRVTAATMTVNGQATLVLTSTATGADNAASLDTSGITNGALKSMLDDPAGKTQLATAQDAVIWLGAKNTGTKLQQASNTFDTIDGVKMTFTKAQAASDDPVTLTVGTDSAATVANVQSFVDAYNKLNSVLADLNAPGDPASGKDPGIFAQDSGLGALRSRITSTLRMASGSQSLPTLGITGQRDGTLALDSGRLTKALAANPNALDDVFGSASASAPKGVLGGLDKLLGQWTSGLNGQISTRRDSVSRLQSTLVTRQATLDDQYNSAYKRYLLQFTSLQQLQSQMSSNSNLFSAMLSGSSSS
ncbi:MAG: flagellar filament capping protein FliD [Pseudomonadota bacterium]